MGSDRERVKRRMQQHSEERWRGRWHKLWAVAALVCASQLAASCSFEPPPELKQDGAPDQGDMAGTLDLSEADGMQPAPLDMTPGLDMEPNLDMEPEGDQDVLLDQGSGADMAEDQDVAQPDASADLDAGHVDQGGALGDACMRPTDCREGSCVALGGEGICAVSCDVSCDAPGFACVAGICLPSEYCAPSGQLGPGCDTCAKCAPGAICAQVAGANGQVELSCACAEGYRGDGYTCADIDECASGAAMCNTNATCLNETGSFRCVCNSGFEGNGVSCTPSVSACAMCDATASCVQVAGNERCQCNAGWAGNGVTCQDINECNASPSPCGANSQCANSPGSFTCTCSPGYAPSPSGVCQDVNECQRTPAPCDPLATCTNTVGSFLCSCPPGIPGNGLSCSPYASCAAIAAANPNSPSGTYTIKTSTGQLLDVHCDMVSDGGVGYTLYRVNSASLGATQQPYLNACSALGLQLVTPRSAAHMDAIIAWNGDPPNLVNVVPSSVGASGSSGLTGRCGTSASCGFYLNGRENTRCRSIVSTPQNTYRWSGSQRATSCLRYLNDSHTTAPTGFYELDLDGAGPIAPFVAYCDMTLNEGGWTLAATSSDDSANTWTWNKRTLWTTDTSDVGSVVSPNRDYKNRAVHSLALRDLLFVHAPSGIWAAYGDVSDGSKTLSEVISATPSPNCEPTSGYAITAGTLTQSGALCSTDLFFNLGDYDGLRSRCENRFALSPLREEATFGPAWSIGNDQGCPFDDPAYSSWGANKHAPNEEADGRGFGLALNRNSSPGNIGGNFISMFVRDVPAIEPSGENTATQRIVRESTAQGEAGPGCPRGSWEDRGDVVLDTGWVICGQ